MRRNVKLLISGTALTILLVPIVVLAFLHFQQRSLEDDPPLDVAVCHEGTLGQANAGLGLWRWPPDSTLSVQWVWRVEWLCWVEERQQQFYSWLGARSGDILTQGSMERVLIEVDSDEAPESIVTPEDRYEISLKNEWSNPLCFPGNCDRQRYWHVNVRDAEAILTTLGGDWFLYDFEEHDRAGALDHHRGRSSGMGTSQ